MISYAFWNNKGGVGKSFLSFVTACEYARRHKKTNVYVIDMCPQANVSETLLGGYKTCADSINKLLKKEPRCTIAGYIEARLNSPFSMIENVDQYVCHPYDTNPMIPSNLYLVCGDYLLEILAEAMRQTSQLAVPLTAWKQVQNWVKDLTVALDNKSDDKDSIFIIDCNPSFAIYTQLALSAADRLVVPFTADDSSRRAIENIVALMYGHGDKHTAAYAKISYFDNAKKSGLKVPTLHSFVSNRVTMYEGVASKAFKAVSKMIKNTMDKLYKDHRTFFSNSTTLPSNNFNEIPDYHAACIVSALTGTPLHKLKAGPKRIGEERVQINKDPLKRYRSALQNFVDLF